MNETGRCVCERQSLAPEPRATNFRKKNMTLPTGTLIPPSRRVNQQIDPPSLSALETRAPTSKKMPTVTLIPPSRRVNQQIDPPGQSSRRQRPHGSSSWKPSTPSHQPRQRQSPLTGSSPRLPGPPGSPPTPCLAFRSANFLANFSFHSSSSNGFESSASLRFRFTLRTFHATAATTAIPKSKLFGTFSSMLRKKLSQPLSPSLPSTPGGLALALPRVAWTTSMSVPNNVKEPCTSIPAPDPFGGKTKWVASVA